MNKILKISFKRALLFSIYEFIMIWFFDVFSFFDKSFSVFLIGTVTLCSILFFHFIVLTFIERSQLELSFRNVLNLTSYLISSLLASLLCCFVFGNGSDFMLIILSGYVVPSFLPSIGFFLLSLFKENDVKINSRSISIKSDHVIEKNEVKENIQFTLENDGGKILLKVPINRIICFEANDNYVVTYYIDKEDKLKKSMERISLKRIDEIVDNLGVNHFSRVHKSYLINHLMIEEIKGKAQAQKIKLMNLEILIPVSRSFDLSVFKSDY